MYVLVLGKCRDSRIATRRVSGIIVRARGSPSRSPLLSHPKGARSRYGNRQAEVGSRLDVSLSFSPCFFFFLPKCKCSNVSLVLKWFSRTILQACNLKASEWASGDHAFFLFSRQRRDRNASEGKGCKSHIKCFETIFYYANSSHRTFYRVLRLYSASSYNISRKSPCCIGNLQTRTINNSIGILTEWWE